MRSAGGALGVLVEPPDNRVRKSYRQGLNEPRSALAYGSIFRAGHFARLSARLSGRAFGRGISQVGIV
jgi:hypothetical protein